MPLVSRLSVAVCLLLLLGCSRRPQPVPVVVVTPPSTLALEAANQEFAKGDYVSAARDFESYLELTASGGERDHAMFHLGLIHSIPGTQLQDWPRAANYLKSVLSEFPQSSYKPAAELILSMRDEAAQLSAEIAKLTAEGNQLRNEGARLRNEVTELQNDAALLRTNSTVLNEQILKLKAQADAVAAELDKRDQRIRQLNNELDRLTRIDSQPRTRQ